MPARRAKPSAGEINYDPDPELEPDDDLADLGVGLHELLRLGQLVERVDAVDQRLQLAAGEERQEILLEALHRRRALRRGAQLVRDAEELEALGVQRVKVDLALHAAVEVAYRR